MSSERPAAAARELLEGAIAARVFPGAVAEVGDRSGVLWRETLGRLTFERDARVVDSRTIFDLASLAKPIATTSVILALMSTGALGLDDTVARFFEEWRGADREHVTIQDLLEHASGLAARLIDVAPQSRR